MKKLLALVLALCMIAGVASALAEASGWDGAYMDSDDFKAYTKNDLDRAAELH